VLGDAEVDLISALETPVTGDALMALGLEV
jgi:hypothetical protein